MLKRNKLSIFLVAVVIGLTIFYVCNPTKETTPIDNTLVVSQRYPLYAQTRLDVLSERNEQISLYEVEISTSDSTEIQAKALENMRALSALTEREVALEKQIVTLGYNDCLVHTSNNTVKVNVLSKTFSVDEFVEIAMIIKGEFGNDYVVVVNVDNPA